MMKFAQWLESKSSNNIHFGSFWKDGRVSVYINGIKYVYITDAVYHNRWQRMIRYRPWTVLNQIKDMVRRGWATQEEPKPEPKPPVQGTLF